MRMVIRADSDPHMGSGHVMRMIALSQAWKEIGGSVTWVTREEASDACQSRMKNAADRVKWLPTGLSFQKDAALTNETLNEQGACCFVMDGYHFPDEYAGAITKRSLRVMVDDIADRKFYDADVILNPNAYAEPHSYTDKTRTSALLLGHTYTLLRDDFRKRLPRIYDRSRASQKRLLVTLGGGDHTQLIIFILRSLNSRFSHGPLEAAVLTGPTHQKSSEIAELARLCRIPVTILDYAEDMPSLLDWTSAALTGGGSTCWETAYMGVPTISLVLAENQRMITDYTEAHHASLNLGWHESISEVSLCAALSRVLGDPDDAVAMARSARSLIDGQGALRAAQKIAGLAAVFTQR
ncbi:MAG: UDP-2,4-diacetamido-2,4,6-trideoxy-beta-L-altropyranose hydrolase [Candidatus Omnitrophica bacterium]|nr:UDP-2,4-diacetamido-2,4,6-trideoxy-beta-L-altropyranose hydrolase [Candidatus Omnitrophota bacterium]